MTLAATLRSAGSPWIARARLAAGLVLTLVLLGTALRLVLLAVFGGTGAARALPVLGLGALRDALVAPTLLLPVLLVLALAKLRFLGRTGPRRVLLGLFGAMAVFGALVEYFFFEEFDARFNNIAIDYVLYPGEVAGNLWQSYDVPLHVLAALAGGALIAFALERFLPRANYASAARSERLAAAGLVLLVAPALAIAAFLLPRDPWHDRRANEVACNGALELVRALWSADLEFPLYYRTLPAEEAHARAARVLGFPAPAAGAFRLERHHTPRVPVTPPRQIVVILEESLGSDFVGALSPGLEDCTPELERHFDGGILLTNLIANGNRTVRGLEGVLCSFVPLPGYALLRRGKSENVATVARVLRERGYETLFVYGGSGTFDRMEPFLAANGWDELVTEDDYSADDFRTAWGVADQYEFDALLARQEQARAGGQRLFATLLSVSNHKPYDFPHDRYDARSEQHGRRGAVRYADDCIGSYLDALQERGLAADTLVLIVGDHGARVYGAEEIPIESYRIPALFVTPDPRWHGQRIERLCSQIDLVPTLLDLAGIVYDAPFLGTSVLGQPDDGGRAFVQHNRDVGLMTDRAMVVLGLRKSMTRYWRAGREAAAFERVAGAAGDADGFDWAGLEADATAVFQSAYELYEARAYTLPVPLGLVDAR